MLTIVPGCPPILFIFVARLRSMPQDAIKKQTLSARGLSDKEFTKHCRGFEGQIKVTLNTLLELHYTSSGLVNSIMVAPLSRLNLSLSLSPTLTSSLPPLSLLLSPPLSPSPVPGSVTPGAGGGARGYLQASLRARRSRGAHRVTSAPPRSSSFAALLLYIAPMFYKQAFSCLLWDWLAPG